MKQILRFHQLWTGGRKEKATLQENKNPPFQQQKGLDAKCKEAVSARLQNLLSRTTSGLQIKRSTTQLRKASRQVTMKTLLHPRKRLKLL
nr:hypothetical protein Iba_scaffold60137CG0010 [Ipomoea batatas]GMD30588.1 hypothetical protein Iba_chr09aCG8410 [Ipomoea batatas]